MKYLSVLFSVAVLLGSAASARQADLTFCKEQFKKCDFRSADDCINQYDTCKSSIKHNSAKCAGVRGSSASKLLGGMTSFPVYLVLLPVTFPFASAKTAEYQECMDAERN